MQARVGAATQSEARDSERACFIAPRWRHKAKVNGSTELAEVLGPTRSFGRGALRRVLARNARRAGSAALPDRSESRRARPSFQPPEQQPLRIVKQQMMSSAELDEDNIVAAIGSARNQASTAQLGVTCFHSGKHRRSRHELICRLEITPAT